MGRVYTLPIFSLSLEGVDRTKQTDYRAQPISRMEEVLQNLEEV
jgi:hypothetical protein